MNASVEYAASTATAPAILEATYTNLLANEAIGGSWLMPATSRRRNKTKVPAGSARSRQRGQERFGQHEPRNRTPMNAAGMSGHCRHALEYEQRDFMQIIRTSGDALLTIINDILDFSKIEADQMELEQPVNVRAAWSRPWNCCRSGPMRKVLIWLCSWIRRCRAALSATCRPASRHQQPTRDQSSCRKRRVVVEVSAKDQEPAPKTDRWVARLALKLRSVLLHFAVPTLALASPKSG